MEMKFEEPTSDELLQEITNDIEQDELFIELMHQLGRQKTLLKLSEIIITEDIPKELQMKKEKVKKSARDLSFDVINDKIEIIEKQMRRLECLMKTISIMFVFHTNNESKENIITMLAVILDIFKKQKKNIDDLQEYLNERKAV